MQVNTKATMKVLVTHYQLFYLPSSISIFTSRTSVTTACSSTLSLRPPPRRMLRPSSWRGGGRDVAIFRKHGHSYFSEIAMVLLINYLRQTLTILTEFQLNFNACKCAPFSKHSCPGAWPPTEPPFLSPSSPPRLYIFPNMYEEGNHCLEVLTVLTLSDIVPYVKRLQNPLKMLKSPKQK